MAHSELAARGRITALFEQCRLQHRQAYPTASLDLDRLNLTGRLTHSRWVHARGHFSDVYKGETNDGTVAAIKMLRLPAYSDCNDKIYRDTVLCFFREFNHRSQLTHINVVFMHGYSLSDGTLSLVSLWQTNGNLVEYLHAKPDASKHDLALDVAEGTHYLHTRSSPLVHGDLKGANVLINEHGIACLADFGLSKQINDLNRQTGFTTTSGATGTLPFTAPELLEDCRFELPCDVYSYGGVLIQIYCPGKVPYYYISNPFQMQMAKSRGEIPRRSSYPEMDGQDTLWQLMSDFWAPDPQRRPTMTDVVRELYAEFQIGARRLQSNPVRPRLNDDRFQPTFSNQLFQQHTNHSASNVRQGLWNGAIAGVVSSQHVATGNQSQALDAAAQTQVRNSQHIPLGNEPDGPAMSVVGKIGREGGPATAQAGGNPHPNHQQQQQQPNGNQQFLSNSEASAPSALGGSVVSVGRGAMIDFSQGSGSASIRRLQSSYSQLGGIGSRFGGGVNPQQPPHQQGQREGQPLVQISPAMLEMAMVCAGFGGREHASLNSEERTRVVNVIINRTTPIQQINIPRMQPANPNNSNIGGQRGPPESTVSAPNQMPQGYMPGGTGGVPFSQPQDTRQPPQQMMPLQQLMAHQQAAQHPSNKSMKRARSPSNTKPESSPPSRDASPPGPKRVRRKSQVGRASDPNTMASYTPGAPTNAGPSEQQQQQRKQHPQQQMVNGHMMRQSSGMMPIGVGPGPGNQPQHGQQSQNSNQRQMQQELRQLQRQLQLAQPWQAQQHAEQQTQLRQQQHPQVQMNALSKLPKRMPNPNPAGIPILAPVSHPNAPRNTAKYQAALASRMSRATMVAQSLSISKVGPPLPGSMLPPLHAPNSSTPTATGNFINPFGTLANKPARALSADTPLSVITNPSTTFNPSAPATMSNLANPFNPIHAAYDIPDGYGLERPDPGGMGSVDADFDKLLSDWQGPVRLTD